MIKYVTATNYLGESLTMGIGDPDKSGLLISSIEGIEPGESQINVTELATIDGAAYNSARIPSRNIVISLIFMGNPTIEDSRYLAYKMFPLKKPINLKVVTDHRSLQIDGYVESNSPYIFDSQEGASVSIVCPSYYFYSLGESTINFGGIDPMFEFPFWNDLTGGTLEETEIVDTIDDHNYDAILDSYNEPINGLTIQQPTDNHIIFSEIRDTFEGTIFYDGDADTGMVITIHFLAPFTNSITLYHTTTRDTMVIDVSKLTKIIGSEIQYADDLIISTVNGKKSVRFLRKGKYYNVLNCINRDADWLQLNVGLNVIGCRVASHGKYLAMNIAYYPLFEGV